jgi:hypothetical protein
MSRPITVGNIPIPSKSQFLVLLDKLVLLLLELLKAFIHIFQLIFCTCGKFLDDLEDSPQSTDHDKGAGLFDRAAQENINDECCDDDAGVEDVEFGTEITIQSIVTSQLSAT